MAICYIAPLLSCDLFGTKTSSSFYYCFVYGPLCTLCTIIVWSDQRLFMIFLSISEGSAMLCYPTIQNDTFVVKILLLVFVVTCHY